MVVQGLHDLLDGADYEFVLVVAVGVHEEVELEPFLLDLLDLVLDALLAGCSSGDLFDLLSLLLDAITQ